MGLLGTVKEIVKRENVLGRAGSVWGRFINQIANGANSFKDSYPWGSEPDLPWAMGGGVLSGTFIGTKIVKNNICHIKGRIQFQYADIFEDPVDIGELLMKWTGSGQRITFELLHGFPYRYHDFWSEAVNVSVSLS